MQSRVSFLAVSAIALAGPLSVAEAHNLDLDLSYIDTSSAAYQRFKDYVDDAVAGNPAYGFSATDATYMFEITGQAQYCQLAVGMVDQEVSDAEAEIASGGAPDIANDSYLYVGGALMDLSQTYDWCSAQLSDSQRSRWSAYAEQAVYNIWNPSDAQWGGNPFHWSGWAIDDPGNNYHYSFVEATMYWALASGTTSQWKDFLANVKLPAIENYFAALPGGGSAEGTGYGSSQRWLFGVYRLWRDATGVDLGNANSHLTDTIAYWVHGTVPTMDRFVPIGDQARSSLPYLYDYNRHLVLEARMDTDDAAARDLASWWLHNISIDHMTNQFNYRHDLMPAGNPTPAPADLWYHAQGVGTLFARTSWTPDATWLAFMAGQYTEGHAHQEQGGFTLFGGGDWLSVTENIFTHSGIQQGTETNNVLRFEHGSDVIRQISQTVSDMTATEDDEGTVHAVADLTPAYNGDPNIGSWQRTIDFTASGELTVTDNYDVSSGTNAVFQVNTPVRPVISGNTAIAGSLKITVVSPSNATLTAVDWTSVDGDYESGWRLDVRANDGRYIVKLGRTDAIFDGSFDG
jgi:hypothetical protein